MTEERMYFDETFKAFGVLGMCTFFFQLDPTCKACMHTAN